MLQTATVQGCVSSKQIGQCFYFLPDPDSREQHEVDPEPCFACFRYLAQAIDFAVPATLAVPLCFQELDTAVRGRTVQAKSTDLS